SIGMSASTPRDRTTPNHSIRVLYQHVHRIGLLGYFATSLSASCSSDKSVHEKAGTRKVSGKQASSNLLIFRGPNSEGPHAPPSAVVSTNKTRTICSLPNKPTARAAARYRLTDSAMNPEILPVRSPANLLIAVRATRFPFMSLREFCMRFCLGNL